MNAGFINHGAVIVARAVTTARLNGQEVDTQLGDPDPRPSEIIRAAVPCPRAQNIAVQVMEHTRDKDRQIELLRQVAADLHLMVRIEKAIP